MATARLFPEAVIEHFEQEQMVRAVELKLGISDPSQIDLVTGDRESRAFADRIRARLAEG